MAASSRPILCTQCGSTTHDIRACLERDEGSRLRGRIQNNLVEDQFTRCMFCNKLGHALCLKMATKPVKSFISAER